jgi:hypothetical protein
MRESKGSRSGTGAPDRRSAPHPVDIGHQHKEQRPSKYEFEGRCRETTLISPGCPGPSRLVQTARLAPRCRGADITCRFSIRTLRPPRQHSGLPGLAR